MADDADYEVELSEQIAEQRGALAEIQDALAAEPSEELEEMRQQLEEAIRELEAALLGMKKARLLALLDGGAAQAQGDAGQGAAAGSSGQHEPSRPTQQQEELTVGDACRFRFEDGRWYAGTLVAVLHDGQAQVSFATPTRPHMLEDAVLPASCLRPARGAAAWCSSSWESGAWAYARPQALRLQRSGGPGPDLADGLTATSSGGGPPTLWPRVQVLHTDDLGGSATVEAQGKTATVAFADLVEEAWLLDSDLEEQGEGEEGGSSEDPDLDLDLDEAAAAQELEEEELEVHGGLGLDCFAHARVAAEAGPQTDTAHFADWEQHSRGIASKLLAKMGYVKGRGLGLLGAGVPTPLEVQLLPQRQGLGGGVEDKAPTGAGAGGRKGKSRGGERSRRKKHADRVRQGREERKDEESHAELKGGAGAVGLFSFINTQLGDKSEAAAKIKAVEVAMLRSVGPQERAGRFGGAGHNAGGASAGAAPPRKEDRHGLMKQSSKIAAAQAKVDHFRAMLQRNSGNKALAQQISATLGQAQAELQGEQAEHARMKQNISGKEAQTKFWGKF